MFGGVEQKICSIVERSAADGIEVTVVTSTTSPTFINELSKYRVNVVALTSFNLCKVIQTLHKLRPDVLQTHQLVDSIITRIYKILTRSQDLILVQRVHTHLNGYLRNGTKKTFVKFIDKITFFCVDYCLCISQTLVHELNYLNQRDRKKIKVLENGTKLPTVRPKHKLAKKSYDTACIVGDISLRKNQLETLQLLEKQTQITKIHLCGNIKDDLDRKISDVIERSNMKIYHHGFLEKSDLHRIYGQADFLILLSKFEGVPTVLLEARFHGLIPIFSNVGATAEYINEGVDGFLFDQDAFPTLPQKIEDLTLDDCQKISLQSYEVFRPSFFEQEMTSSFLKLYYGSAVRN